MNRSELRSEVDEQRAVMEKIRADLAGEQDRLVDLLAARVGRLLDEANQLNALAALLIETRDRLRR